MRRFGRPALAGLLTLLTGLPVCHLVFRCGCTWLFAGGDSHCDMRMPGPPDCPVCTSLPVGAAFAASLFGLWLGAVTLAHRFLRRASD
jgi:hypothetical protein